MTRTKMAHDNNLRNKLLGIRKYGTWTVCTLVVALAIVLHFSIRHKEEAHVPLYLVRADSMMEKDPSAALRLLTKDGKPFSAAPEYEKMYHKLLMANATDLLGQRQASDSAMLNVAKYYEKHGSTRELVRSIIS